MIIGISGKMQSGKNTVASIIQYLTNPFDRDIKTEFNLNEDYSVGSQWKQVAFAGKLKQIVSILTGIPVEDLEKQEVKDRVLGEEWWYCLADNNKRVPYIKELHEGKVIKLIKPTARQLLQEIGTDAMRDVIHPNCWVNALFVDYKPIYRKVVNNVLEGIGVYPNWIITDLRFPNELQAIKDRGGITIRVNRENRKTSKEWQVLYPDIVVLDPDGWNRDERYDFEWNKELITLEKYKNRVMRSTCKFKANFDTYFKQDEHPSETSLDSATFDFVINNNRDIEHLINEVRKILEKLNILK